MNPSGMSLANSARAAMNPSRRSTLVVATVPVISLVTPRLRPCKMKNVLNVIRKLGMPVRTTSQPLTNPMASERARPASTPTHMFSDSW